MNALKSIWVIDDDIVFTFLFKKIITKVSGVGEVSYFSNGGDAMETAKKSIASHTPLPELILLDINMPVLDGWQFLDAFRELLPAIEHIPLIYMSSSSVEEEDRERALSSGLITDFIAKPMNAAELQDLIDRLLDQS